MVMVVSSCNFFLAELRLAGKIIEKAQHNDNLKFNHEHGAQTGNISPEIKYAKCLENEKEYAGAASMSHSHCSPFI